MSIFSIKSIQLPPLVIVLLLFIQSCSEESGSSPSNTTVEQTTSTPEVQEITTTTEEQITSTAELQEITTTTEEQITSTAELQEITTTTEEQTTSTLEVQEVTSTTIEQTTSTPEIQEVISTTIEVEQEVSNSSTEKENISIVLEEAANEQSEVLFAVDAGADQYYKENTEVTLNGQYTNDITVRSFLWEQTSGEAVTIISQEINSIIFITPEIEGGETTTELTFDFTITNAQNIKVTDSITLYIEKDILPLEVNAGDDQTVDSHSTVNLVGTTTGGNTESISSLWSQISGPEISLLTPSNASINFTAPLVTQTEVITLSYTAEDASGISSQDFVEISILPNSPEIAPHVLLFTEERIKNIREKIIVDSTAWDSLTDKVTNYFDQAPYNIGEYTGAFAVAYYVSGDPKYIDRAIELLNLEYFNETDIGWEDYQSRNLFRLNARWGIMGYSWVKDYISLEEQGRIENILKLWGEYWLDYIDYDNDFQELRISDTDEITSITKNMTLLGYVLSHSNTHSALGEEILNAGDTLLERYVVEYYMNDIMKGGTWAEGSDYSPATQIHWIETFLINKEHRGIDFPTNYAKLAMESLLHQTISGGNSVYKYGSEEEAVDYDELSDDYRYGFALSLMSILEDENDIALIHQWFEKIITKEGFPSSSMVTHFDRLLFHDPSIASTKEPDNLDTLHYSEGVGLIAARDNWETNGSNLYFINRAIRVDHEHQDALSFDVAFNGGWITKEATGYSGVSVSSLAHNTIIIENADSGSSSPTRRPVGTPKYNSIYNDDDVTFISASAENAYNMSGYFATDYTKLVNRQLAFIKPSIVIVYDHVITDEKEIGDLIQYNSLGLTEDMAHTRWVKVIQHVQDQPTPIEGLINTYQVESENNTLVYQVVSPANATVNIIDEKELWDGTLEYQLPENQRKWHFEVSTTPAKLENEFITTLSFGKSDETTASALYLDSIVMTQENSYILEGNVTGLAIDVNQSKYIILFKKDPEEAIESVKIQEPEHFENATIYTIGFDVDVSK